MKVYYDIIQGTPEWHEVRYGKIGGTVSDGLFKSTDTLLIDLIAARLEPFKLEKEGFQNEAMLRGTELEPFGRMNISRIAKIKFKEAGWIENLTTPILGISPDGISECETIACEIKCPSRSVHISTLMANEIPLSNIHQCVHYFTVNPKLERLYFGSFRPECKHRLFTKLLTLDSVVNLGTKAKPVLKPIGEWAQIARGAAMVIDAKISEALKSLNDAV